MGKYFLFFLLFLLTALAKAQDIKKEVKDVRKQRLELLINKKRLLKEITEHKQELHNLSSTHEEKKALISKRHEEIAKQLALLARLGRVNPLRILRDPKVTQNTLRSITLVRAFTASLKQHIQQTLAELNEASALSKEMEEKTQLNIEFLKNIEVQQAQLGILEKEKLEHFKKNELDRLADEDDVNTLLNESRITLSKKEKSAAEAAAKQRLPFCRLERPVRGNIIKDQALQNEFSPQAKGIIFETPKNAEVSAPYAADIVFKGPFRSQGDILILDHGEKVYTIFMGMHKINAQVGQKVYAGERLGTMAGYGAKPPKLYLELRQEGKSIDPSPYLLD
ncbi:MAG: peptidoglycan DD-metalloendopeptidase family protein [Alphaproteobacteria bacterium]|jgi:septal ring factor EnvC (AmiA/AmiB activator)|nr:peptidoglycan DD-metalloendopeptidase family protein [Alphaproteobacteria bacterium]MBP9777255.1 peptidoglycan DD-metalloendopeptidase family protein [Alphaproteobacteria bacterium]